LFPAPVGDLFYILKYLGLSENCGIIIYHKNGAIYLSFVRLGPDENSYEFISQPYTIFIRSYIGETISVYDLEHLSNNCYYIKTSQNRLYLFDLDLTWKTITHQKLVVIPDNSEWFTMLNGKIFFICAGLDCKVLDFSLRNVRVRYLINGVFMLDHSGTISKVEENSEISVPAPNQSIPVVEVSFFVLFQTNIGI
jgi:hypothetical protein